MVLKSTGPYFKSIHTACCNSRKNSCCRLPVFFDSGGQCTWQTPLSIILLLDRLKKRALGTVAIASRIVSLIKYVQVNQPLVLIFKDLGNTPEACCDRCESKEPVWVNVVAGGGGGGTCFCATLLAVLLHTALKARCPLGCMWPAVFLSSLTLKVTLKKYDYPAPDCTSLGLNLSDSLSVPDFTSCPVLCLCLILVVVM